MYGLLNNLDWNRTKCVIRFEDGAYIPISEDNTDYQTFKRDLTEGVELQDAEGNVMTKKQVTAFIKTLP